MKHGMCFTSIAVLLFVIIVSGFAQAPDENIKGRIAFDFPNTPEPTIEVNLSGKLLSLIAKSANQEPEINHLISMVKGVYVRGYDKNVSNFSQMIRHYESVLNRQKWETVAKIKEDNETVQVRLLFDQEVVSGIFVVVSGTEGTFFVNIFGRIDFEKVGELLGKLKDMNIDLDIPHLKELEIDAESKRKADASR